MIKSPLKLTHDQTGKLPCSHVLHLRLFQVEGMCSKSKVYFIHAVFCVGKAHFWLLKFTVPPSVPLTPGHLHCIGLVQPMQNPDRYKSVGFI